MRAAIDATSLLLCSAGVKTYIHYWLSALVEAAAREGDSITAYPLAVPIPAAIDHQHGALDSTWADHFRLIFAQLNNNRFNPAINLALLGADLFHCSQHTLHLPRRKPVTSTIFDLSCWTTPERHTAANIAATKLYAEKVLKVSDGLIAISEHARNDAVAILGIPAERIRVIYPGVAAPFFDPSPEEAGRVRSLYSLDAPYVLFVGCIEPRKNIPGLIRAFRGVRESLPGGVELIVAGPFGWESDDVLTLLQQSGPSIRYLGYLPEADLPGLVRGASAFVFPSFYEGFGLPLAQAMAAGVPVIASNRSCLPEVAGDAGLLIDPDSPEEIGAAIARVLDCPGFAAELAARGRRRAERFRWPLCAGESLRFFRQVVELRR